MGKAKKKKFRAPKPQPTGLSSVKETEQQLEDGSDPMSVRGHGTVATVVEELQSVNVETRECGCATLANLVNQQAAIPQLMKHNIVKIVAPLIVDPCAHIRHVALGALRNLSVSGGHDVCEEMVQKDILTPLAALFHKYGSGWQPEKREKSVKHADTSEDIFTEAVHLLWNLCESTDMAVTVVNKENLIQYLLPCLQWDLYGYTTALAVGHCLHTVTENNKMAAMFCQTSEVMALLHKLMVPVDTAESILLSTLVIGIVMNVSDLRSPQVPISSTVETLAKVLSVEINGLIQEAAQNREQMCSSEESEDASCDVSTDKKDVEPTGKLKDVKQILTAQQTSLEIIANLCCSGDDDWEDVESNESSSSDDMNMEINMEEDISQDFTPLSMPTEVLDALLKHDVLSKVLNKAQPMEEEKQTVLNNCVGGRKIVNGLLRVQTDALLCMNNMLNTLAADQLGGLVQLHKMWEGLVQLATSPQAKTQLELLEAVTSAMRAVIQKLAELASPKFSEITIADLQFLFAMSRQCENSQVRVNAVRCVATIGGLLAKIQTPHPLLKDIGHFLVEVIGHDSDLWVVAEALDSLFDVFGEDHVDPVVKEISLVDRLKNILPMLKSRINSQRGQLGEHYPVITTARTNLIRFIKYKTAL